MMCAAAVTAQFVGGKATRDALFLTSLDVTALPAMLMATSVFSILLVTAHGRLGRLVAPAVLVPLSFTLSGALFVAEWFFRSAAPSATAILVYLHVSGAGPMLASGFWLITSEAFSPRTAKKGFGRIAGAGTLGGLAGALVSERIAATSGVPTMLLVLAAIQLLAAWLVWQFARTSPAASAPAEPDAVSPTAPRRSGLRVIAEAPHLRSVVALVLLGTTSAAMLDYLFKARAVETFGPGDGLLRFFALYYAGTSLISFLLQTLASRSVLERFGLALSTSTPSIALLAGSIGGLIAPGLGSLMVARGGESIFRASWFRAGYELFYTPIPAAEKRSAKSIIDVGFERLGDAVGGGLVRVVTLLAPAVQSSAILSVAMLSSVGAIVAASHLNRWYLRTLENSLVNRGANIDLSETGDGSTAKVLSNKRRIAAAAVTDAETTVLMRPLTPRPGDPLVRDIMALRSRDLDRAIQVLTRDEGMSPSLVPHVIPLLANDALADYALFALRKVAEERAGELTDALIDPNQDVAVRRRVARIFSVAVSQRAADGVALALDDSRFDVRFQAARSLAAILDKNPRIRFDRDRIYEVILREVAVGVPVWESQRLLDGFVSESPLDAFVRDRAGQSLAHVFTLLSLVLPREPLQIAFRSLHSNDSHLRGTALEYLEGVLPTAVRQQLWPFLVYRRPQGEPQAHDKIMANLLRSSGSITLQQLGGQWDKERVAGFGSV